MADRVVMHQDQALLQRLAQRMGALELAEQRIERLEGQVRDLAARLEMAEDEIARRKGGRPRKEKAAA